jgi:hypothetical protein
MTPPDNLREAVICKVREAIQLGTIYITARQANGVPIDPGEINRDLVADAAELGDQILALPVLSREGATLDALRAAGWMVAVHNDYRLHGEPHTFWLLTHPDGRWIKGEGRTDAEAITQAALSVSPLPVEGGGSSRGLPNQPCTSRSLNSSAHAPGEGDAE